MITNSAGILSPGATEIFERLRVTRDASRTCARDELTALLRERGLPVFDGVLDFEERFGGVVWGKETFGACVALRSGFTLGVLASLVGADFDGYQGQVLVPVSFRSYYPRAYFWMSEASLLYVSNEVDTFPVADTAACFWEREALKADKRPELELTLRWRDLPTFTDDDFAHFEPRSESSGDDDDDDDAPPSVYDDDPQAEFDGKLAAALGLPVFLPATDRWRRVWFDGARLLFPHHPWQPADRLVRAPDMDGLVEMAGAAQAVRPSVVAQYRGPLGAAPAPGEPVAARLHAYEEVGESVVGELLFIGTKGAYRVHLDRHAEPRSFYRMWQEREEAWTQRAGN